MPGERGDSEPPPLGLAELLVEVHPDEIAPTPEAVPASGHRRLVFLNRRGGAYSPGSTYDASSNTAPFLSQEVTILPYERSNADFAKVLACVRGLYAAFNLDIVDADPGAETHLEVVLGGLPQDAGFPSNYGGIAPIHAGCGVVERGIGLVFTKRYASLRAQCEVAAHELGHMVGLDHAFFCPDPMTYLSGCGEKSFQDLTVQCGEDAARSCRCSSSQNSVAVLTANLGSFEDPGALPFDDITYSIFRDAIIWLYEEGITSGCGPRRFCPDDPVTRGQMAAFLTRALKLPAAPRAGFTDTVGHLFEKAIDRLYAAGITVGCGGTRFCPDDPVTRGQMAAFLTRALSLPAAPSAGFTDTAGHLFEKVIDRLYAARITTGCGNGRYCPDDAVTRGQMAAFLRRGLR